MFTTHHVTDFPRYSSGKSLCNLVMEWSAIRTPSTRIA
jgi:hypothetical protein